MRGTFTLLFTDVEGSTRLLQRFGDASVAMLEVHKAILRSTVAEYGGREVDVAGDGFFMVFDVARDALAGAVEAQRRLLAHEWPGGEPVRVRMGLHTGEPIVVGSKYLGLDVHRAARICAAGHGSQILMSATTRQLVINELPAGVVLRDLGGHRLKDLAHSEQIFQVAGAGLPVDFPPLRSIGPDRSNLPVQSTRLIGRETDVDAVKRLLSDEHVRLVTLTGPGGTGKTRLALHTGESLAGSFADGVSLVQLAATPEPGLVASAIAQTLGVSTNGEQGALAGSIDYLRARELLLLLDNFEHVIGAAGIVAELLSSCPRLKVLATSRIALNLMGEREFPVPPLPAPDPRRERSSEQLLRYPAIELFAQRASAVNPSFVMDGPSVVAVAEICYRLDGLPLAIELAAARVKVFPPKALLARLDKRLELLSGGARDMPARHRTLRQSIGWSYDLLDASEQALFRRLSVFAGGCSFEAMEAVCEAAGALSLSPIDGVSALVDKSLLRQEVTADGDPRYVMLETIREFALEQLAASGEEDATRAAHADFFIALVEQAEPELTGPMQMHWLGRLNQEHDNLRGAFAWIERKQDAERGLHLAGALWRFWVVRGHMMEGHARLLTMLEIPGGEAAIAHRLKVLAGAATIAFEQGLLNEATQLLEENLALARDADDRHVIGRALTNSSWVAFHRGEHEQARDLARESLAMGRELKDLRGVASALNNLGWIAIIEADYAQARDLLEETLVLRRKLGEPRGVAYGEINLAWPMVLQGDFERAEVLLGDAIRIVRALGDAQLLGHALVIFAQMRAAQDRHDEAIEGLEETIGWARDSGHQWHLGMCLQLLSAMYMQKGDLERARAYYEQGKLATVVEVKWIAAQADRAAAEFCRVIGDHREAGSHYGRALVKLSDVSARREISDCVLGMAAMAAARSDYDRAATLAGAFEALREEIESPILAYDRRLLDGIVADGTKALGLDTFERARAAGRKLPWQQSVELATRGIHLERSA
jgi:predicted ATPase/class 3 adenylate cyclase